MSSEFTAYAEEINFGGGAKPVATTVSHTNGLHLPARQLAENLHAVQEKNSLPPTSGTTEGRWLNFAILATLRKRYIRIENECGQYY